MVRVVLLFVWEGKVCDGRLGVFFYLLMVLVRFGKRELAISYGVGSFGKREPQFTRCKTRKYDITSDIFHKFRFKNTPLYNLRGIASPKIKKNGRKLLITGHFK